MAMSYRSRGSTRPDPYTAASTARGASAASGAERLNVIVVAGDVGVGVAVPHVMLRAPARIPLMPRISALRLTNLLMCGLSE